MTDTYAIAARAKEGFPCLKKINLTTLQLETINYRPVTQWSTYAKALLANLGNGDIAYAQKDYLFILDTETLTVKETLHTYLVSYYHQIRSIKSYFNTETNESCHLLEKNWN